MQDKELTKQEFDELWMSLWNENISKGKNEPPSFTQWLRGCKRARKAKAKVL